MSRTINRPPAASPATRSLSSALGGQRKPAQREHLDEALHAARVLDALTALCEHNKTLCVAEIARLQQALAEFVVEHARGGLYPDALAGFEARVVASWPVAVQQEAS